MQGDNGQDDAVQPSSGMSEEGRARMLGAGILMLLAVVFLPIIFDGHPDREGQVWDAPSPVPEIDRGALPVPELLEAAEELVELPMVDAPVARSLEGIGELGVPGSLDQGAEPVMSLGKALEASVPSPAAPDVAQTPPAGEVESGDGQAQMPPALQGGAWVIQVGSFSTRGNAEKLSAALKKKDYPAFVEAVRIDGKDAYRVRVGPERERMRAESLEKRLRKEKIGEGRAIDTKIYPWTPGQA